MEEFFARLARYNSLANRRLYDAVAGLSQEDYEAARPAFFGSIRGTLNHILVGDRIWLARFEGCQVLSTGLDAILHPSLAALRRARETEDTRIEAFVDGLDRAFLASTIRYINHERRTFEDQAAMLLQHFFNHQTHHRGQVHDMLCQTAVTPPSLDMHRLLNP